ncbi:MAG: M20/M25/M40 family metallo-hydrolase, partial [Planctomycetes bacterium]|nr:M20/M25/M40 family metallo-hydrolase [Planctomycetota bacterium]
MDPVSLLQKIVATPGTSRDEGKRADLLMGELGALGLQPVKQGRNIVCRIERGKGPTLMLNTHIDTVPPAMGYTRDPYNAEVKDGKIYGLGSNDAGGCIVSMTAATLALKERKDWSGTLLLALTVEEEVNGADGMEALLKEIPLPDAAMVGEPTGLNVCIAQKGLVVMDCTNTGQSCHAANAWRVPHKNAILEAMGDIPKVYQIAFKDRDDFLGPTTLNVTVIQGGTVHNSIPDK